jgi:serine protease
MLATNPQLTPDQVKSALTASARAFPAACSGCGAGIVDAAAAVAKAGGTTVVAPTPAPTPTPTPAPTPTPTATAVLEVESNNTVATAQAILALPSTVSGKLSSNTDLDHFKLSLPAGKTLTATLTAGSTSAYGLNAYTASGTLISSIAGTATGATRILKISNGGSAAATLVLRVARTSGAAGSYQLALTQ